MRSALLSLTLLASPVFAQSTETEELIAAAEKAWNDGDCANAYPLLKEAYLQSKQSKLLTSIGQCAAFLQLDTSALAAYCAYQTLEPNSPYKETVANFVKDLSDKTQQSCPQSSVFYTPPEQDQPSDKPAPQKRRAALIVAMGAAAGTVKGVTDSSRTPIAGGNSLPEFVISPEAALYATPLLTVGALLAIQVTNTDGAIGSQTGPKLSGALRVKYRYGRRERFTPLLAGELGFGQFVQNFPTGFNGAELGKDSIHSVGPFLGLGWAFEDDFTPSAALTGSFTLRGYLADNPVSNTTDIPIFLVNLSLGVRVGI
jgi:hypothetical protein